jgi:signal transduction histidine kinase
VRLRLTLTYTALFVVTGAALLGVCYVLVQHREKGPGPAVQILCTKKTADGQTQSGFIGGIAGIGPGPAALQTANCPTVVGSFYYHSSGNGGASGGVVTDVSGTAGQPPIKGSAADQVSRLTATVKASQAQTLDSFKFESALALGLLTIVSFGLSWWMAGRALSPVHRITATARSLSERTLHARINLAGPNDEIKQLADTFDAMLGRLDRAFHSQRRFVANASHELRTPLATERVLIDEALANRSASPADMRSILEQLRTNSEETERLIDALLVLARSERGIEEWSSVSLSEAVTSVVDQSEVEAAGAGVTLSSDVPEVTPVVVSGDPGLLERLVGNLVENAIRHNVAGGTVSVSVRQEAEAGVLEVVNTGPELDPASVAGLVEPFRRAGPDRGADSGGVGLGLSIVDAIVTAHRGRLDLTAPAHGGMAVLVWLPLSGELVSSRGAGAGSAGVGSAGARLERPPTPAHDASPRPG